MIAIVFTKEATGVKQPACLSELEYRRTVAIGVKSSLVFRPTELPVKGVFGSCEGLG